MTNEIKNDDNERWLSDGDCSKCRREKYCSKPCKAQKQRKEAIIRQLIRNAAGSGRIRKAMEGALHG